MRMNLLCFIHLINQQTKRVHFPVDVKRLALRARKSNYQQIIHVILVFCNGNGQLNWDKCTYVQIFKLMIKKLRNVQANVKMGVFAKMVSVNAEKVIQEVTANTKMLTHQAFCTIL